jgi:hypothetical protein
MLLYGFFLIFDGYHSNHSQRRRFGVGVKERRVYFQPSSVQVFYKSVSCDVSTSDIVTPTVKIFIKFQK